MRTTPEQVRKKAKSHRREDGIERLGRGRLTLFYMLTIVLSVLVVLAAAEAMVRLSVPEETFWPVSNIFRPSEIPGVLYTYKPDFEGTAFGVDIKTNSLGFRGPEWSREKNANTFRIALVGDSYAFGYGVPFENSVGEALAAILEQYYEMPAEVLNFGVNGYNSRQQRAILEHLALGYSPNMVVLLPTNNDHDAALLADQAGWLHWDGAVENEKSRIVDKSIEKVEVKNVPWWMAKSHLLLYLKLVQKQLTFLDEAQTQRELPSEQAPARNWMGEFPPGPISERLAESVYKPLEDMLTLTKEHQLPVIIASFCASVDYRQMFQVIERDHGVPVLELPLLFPEARSWKELTSEFGLGWNDHLNAVAHRRFAEALADLIETHGYHPRARRNS